MEAVEEVKVDEEMAIAMMMKNGIKRMVMGAAAVAVVMMALIMMRMRMRLRLMREEEGVVEEEEESQMFPNFESVAYDWILNVVHVDRMRVQMKEMMMMMVVAVEKFFLYVPINVENSRSKLLIRLPLSLDVHSLIVLFLKKYSLWGDEWLTLRVF
jgi:hypothetical protein